VQLSELGGAIAPIAPLWLRACLRLIRSEKNNVLILEKLLYDEEQKQFSKQKCRECS